MQPSKAGAGSKANNNNSEQTFIISSPYVFIMTNLQHLKIHKYLNIIVASAAASIDAQITSQGNKIRDLKSQKSSKEAIDIEVKSLLSLKAEFKKVVGKDWDPKGKYGKH